MLPKKAKLFILVIVHHMMSVDVHWRSTAKISTKACKTVNQILITMLQIEVDETTVDETGVDEMVVDETGVDELGCYPNQDKVWCGHWSVNIFLG